MAKKEKPRRRHGEGSYAYYSARQKYRAFFTDPEGRRISGYFEEEQDAKDWLALKRAEVIQQDYISPSAETLGEYSIYYLTTYCKNSIRIRTYERYLGVLSHAEPLSGYTLQELLPEDFVRLYAQIDRSGATKKKLHMVLKQILQQAVKEGKIKKNPMNNIPKSAIPKDRRIDVETFSPEELRIIFEAAETTFYENLFLLLSMTGIRISEALGLRWRDFDNKAHRIHIRQTLHNSATQGFVFEEPKSAASRRQISIPTIISEKLAKMNQYHPELIFTNTRGGALSRVVVLDAWTKLLIKAGVKHRGIHTLRHTHATLLLKAGVPITEVSRRLGHSRVSMTLDVYSHAIPADDSTITDTISRIYTI